MNKCLSCGKETNNPKFCCKSCAAKHNNKKYPKRGDGLPHYCLNCGKQIKHPKKYCSHTCQQQHQQKQWEEKWFSGEISGFYETNHWGNIPDRIRTYLFNKHNSKCVKCGWGEINPYTNKVPLEVEHIDGNYKNNRPENLTLLCPNCHSLTETYRGRNKGKGRKKTWKLIN